MLRNRTPALYTEHKHDKVQKRQHSQERALGFLNLDIPRKRHALCSLCRKQKLRPMDRKLHRHEQSNSSDQGENDDGKQRQSRVKHSGRDGAVDVQLTFGHTRNGNHNWRMGAGSPVRCEFFGIIRRRAICRGRGDWHFHIGEDELLECDAMSGDGCGAASSPVEVEDGEVVEKG